MYLPESSKTKTTKDAVISILTQKWPLTSKEVFNSLKKEHSFNGTYQATHKTANQLLDERILEKNGKNYHLSQNWINNLKNFSINLEENYSGNCNKKYIISPDFQGTVKWHFDDYSLFTVEIAKFIMNAYKWYGGKNGIGILRHGWWPFNFKFLDFSLLINMLKTTKGGYVIIQEDTPFSRWISKQYLSAGVNDAIIGMPNLNLEHDMMFTEEVIIQVNFSDETKKLQDEIYSKVHDLADLLKEFIFNKHSEKKIEIEVLITRNKALSQTIRQQLMEKFFSGEKK